ncbi:MAG: GNAT family N-acetyltransferase [Casimicrobiaceae bacterium]
MTAALAAPFSVRKGHDEVSTARERLDLGVIHGFLAASYWAAGIPRATVERALEGSLNFGLYREGTQIGFARFVADGATFAYLADVFVLDGYRGQGLAKWLVGMALTHPALQGLRRVLLATRDAHALYAQLGFKPLPHPERFMEIFAPDVYAKPGG